MRLGTLTGVWWLAEGLSAVESLERAAALGFRTVDLRGVFHAGPRHLSGRDRRAVAARHLLS